MYVLRGSGSESKEELDVRSSGQFTEKSAADIVQAVCIVEYKHQRFRGSIQSWSELSRGIRYEAYRPTGVPSGKTFTPLSKDAALTQPAASDQQSDPQLLGFSEVIQMLQHLFSADQIESVMETASFLKQRGELRFGRNQRPKARQIEHLAWPRRSKVNIEQASCFRRRQSGEELTGDIIRIPQDP